MHYCSAGVLGQLVPAGAPYDALCGVADVSAEDANLKVSYDRDTVTDADQMLFKPERAFPKVKSVYIKVKHS